MSKRHWFGLVAAVLVTISLLDANHVPLYDGVGFPDEPYRYVQPPEPSLATKAPPTTSSLSMTVTGGENSADDGFRTGESGPQFLGYVLAHSFKTAGDASHLTLHVQPLAPDSNQSSAGPILGNIYHLSATSDSPTDSGVRFSGNSARSVYVELRLPQGYDPPAKIAYRANAAAAWTILSTSKIGTDIYLAYAPGFGDFGMVKPASTPSSSPSASTKAQATGTPTVTPSTSTAPQTTDKKNSENSTQNSSTSSGVIFAVIVGVTVIVIAFILLFTRIKLTGEQEQSHDDDTTPPTAQ